MTRPAPTTALVLINRHACTVRSRGPEAVRSLVRERPRGGFRDLEVRFFEDDVVAHVKQAAASGRYHTIIAGGGDGTIAAAATPQLPHTPQTQEHSCILGWRSQAVALSCEDLAEDETVESACLVSSE